MQLRWVLTGGRPMALVGYLFPDVATGRPVSLWLDKLGRPWIAEGPWSLFRIAPFNSPMLRAVLKEWRDIPVEQS